MHPKLRAALESLGPDIPRKWEQADELGRVAMALAIAQAVSRKLGEAKGHLTFEILFQEATR